MTLWKSCDAVIYLKKFRKKKQENKNKKSKNKKTISYFMYTVQLFVMAENMHLLNLYFLSIIKKKTKKHMEWMHKRYSFAFFL